MTDKYSIKVSSNVTLEKEDGSKMAEGTIAMSYFSLEMDEVIASLAKQPQDLNELAIKLALKKGTITEDEAA